MELSESGGFYIRQGQPVLVPNAPCNGMVRVALESGEFLGVGEILDDGRVAPRRLIVTEGDANLSVNLHGQALLLMKGGVATRGRLIKRK